MALKRFVDGIAKEPFFQKRAPDNTPDWIRTAELTFPSRPDGGRDRRRRRGRAWPGSSTSAASTSTRTRSVPTTSTTRTSCASTSTRCRACPGRRSATWRWSARRRSTAVGLVGWPKTSGSRGIHINVRIEPRWTYPEVRRAALALARDVERRAPDRGDLEVVEGGAPRRLPRLQPERQGPHRRVGLLDPAAARRPRLDAADLGRGPDGRGRGIHASRRSRRATPSDRRPGCGHRRGGRLAGGAAGAVGRTRGARARATRRGRRTTPSRQASRHASSRRASGGPTPSTSRVGARPAGRHPKSQAERAAAVAAGDPNAGLPTEWEGSRPTPTGRRKTNDPGHRDLAGRLQGRGARGPRALEGAPPGRRRPLEPADVLVDGMRGRSSLWYRVRVNLTHVPEADRPAAGAARPGLRPVGRLRVAGRRRAAGTRAAQAQGDHDRRRVTRIVLVSAGDGQQV